MPPQQPKVSPTLTDSSAASRSDVRQSDERSIHESDLDSKSIIGSDTPEALLLATIERALVVQTLAEVFSFVVVAPGP